MSIEDSLRQDDLTRAAADLESRKQAGANYRTGLEAAARVNAARIAITPEMNKQEGLGDIGTSYGGERLDEAAVHAAQGIQRGEPSLADLAPKRRATPPEPTQPRSLVGLDALLQGPRKAGEIEMVGGVPTGRVISAADRIPAQSRDILEAAHGVVQPIHVIRGVRSSYAGGAPGEEYTSLQRAAQGINRFLGSGEYAPPGASEAALRNKYDLTEIAARGKAARVAAGKGQTDEEYALDYLTKMLLPEHGVAEKDAKGNPTGSMILPPYAETVRQKYLPSIKSLEDVPGILEKIKPELEAAKQVSILDTERSRAKMLANYRSYRQSQGLPPDPTQEQFFLRGVITPENYKGPLGWLNYQLPKPAGPSLADLASVPRSAGPSLADLASSGVIGPVDEVPPLQPVYDLLQLRSAQTGKRFKERYESDLQRAARAM